MHPENGTNTPNSSLGIHRHGIGEDTRSRALFWKGLFTVTLLLGMLYIFMEWLFFVTMPSFMSVMTFYARLKILLLSGWEFAILCIVLLAVFIVIDFIALITHASAITRYWGVAIPAIILSALVLILVDNFTYTVFKFGISTSTGVVRGLYAVLFILLTSYIYFRMYRFFNLRGNKARWLHKLNPWFYASLGILVLTTGLGLANLKYDNLLQANRGEVAQPASQLPNIILLGSDGLNANHLSVYGYYRDTTPRLQELAQSSLVAENAFTNAGNSAGSVISIMTSKLPTQTRLLYPPDILTGINSYQHLPGILRNLGYQLVEFGVPYYIDAFNYNLQNGFDVVNNRTLPVSSYSKLSQKLGFENEAYFLTRVMWRISDRILHIFFVREMQNPYDIVTQPAPNLSDDKKINQALALFDHPHAPLFIHIHLLGTHGGYYAPKVRVFSKNEAQPGPWLTDFYDDTLLGFDAFVGKVIDRLKANGQFDNTILIIYTDHNKEFKSDERIPLIIHFPGGENAGQITWNVENMDIAPTILDYLGLAEPSWMEGQSLLKDNSSERRLIFSTGTSKVKPNEQEISFLDPDLNKPPFYQFSYLSVLDCQRMYTLDLTSYQWSSKDVPGYVNPCRPQDLLSVQAVKQAISQRLEQDGFDTSSLP